MSARGANIAVSEELFLEAIGLKYLDAKITAISVGQHNPLGRGQSIYITLEGYDSRLPEIKDGKISAARVIVRTIESHFEAC